MGLLESVIGALATQGQAGSQGGGSGGLGDLGGLGGLIGAVTGGGPAAGGGQAAGGGAALIAGLIGALLSGQGGGGAAGGLPGLLEKFQRGGLGDVASSWVGTGENLPISPSQLEGALGSDLLGNLARQFGLSPGDAASQLSEVLPGVVDKLTPEGRLPSGDFSDIGSLLGRLGGSR